MRFHFAKTLQENLQAQKALTKKPMEYLPQEIVLDILARLPVTSLLQFKLVCRAWHNFAQDPLIVRMHLSRLGENDPCLILHSDYPIRNQLYTLELSALNDNNQKVNKIRVPIFPEFDVVGSCKGMLCLCDSLTKNALYIYNPFTRAYMELPKSKEFPNQDVVFGFGFHQTTKEYKVVKVVYYRIPSELDRYFGLSVPSKSEVQVFTLGCPTWRSLGRLPYCLYQRQSQVLSNGRIHWRTWPQRYSPSRLLISFDLEDEQFRVIPKPDCSALDMCNFTLVVLRGCLSAVVPCNYGQLEIWVMKDYGVKESWIKEFNIAVHVPRGLEQDVPQSFSSSKFYHNSSFVRVLGLLRNGDILLEYKCRALVSYNPKTGIFKDLLLQEMPYLFEAAVHEGSLNWIDTAIVV